jgi:general secretion pathway protein C
MKRLPILFTLLAVIALSASIAYWIMELYKPAQRPLAAMPQASMADPSPEVAATLFGGQAMAAVASNYQLTGVIASGANGVAILIADGQPPKAVPVGKEFSSGVVLKEVQPRFVMLSEGGVLKRIELAADDKAGASLSMTSPGGMPDQQHPQMQQPQMQQPPPQMHQPMPMPPQPPQQQQEQQNSGTTTDAPMEVPAQQQNALPPGVPPPPPSPAQMPTPTLTFSNRGGPPPPNQ